jgi:hypothetical protein
VKSLVQGLGKLGSSDHCSPMGCACLSTSGGLGTLLTVVCVKLTASMSGYLCGPCHSTQSLEGSWTHGALIAALRAHPGVLRRLDGLHLRVVDPDLPLELKGADNATILDYYRDLLSEPSVVSRRCRVMLLGNGGVGKTTLAQRLVTGTPIQPGSTDTTHGVLQRASKQPPLDHALCAFNRRSLRDRYSPCADYWTLSHEQAACIPSDGTLEVSITDFGGQVRTTRAMFFSHTLRNCTLIDSTTARC